MFKRIKLIQPVLVVVVILAMLAALAGVATAASTTVVVPNNLATAECNVNNVFPFSQSTFRYQQVYEATQFATSSGPQLVSQIAFRPDAQTGFPFSKIIPNIQINLSTTSGVPDGLSPVFASNVGGDDTVVYIGSLLLSSSDTGPVGGPKDFDIVIDLQNPFIYDPVAGNLLLDVRIFSGTFTTPFDAHVAFGDTISRVLSQNVNSPTGVADPFGLVTRFSMSEATQEVEIDVKPGSGINTIGCDATNSPLAVAILSDPDFDATTVDADTVRFGKTGTEAAVANTANNRNAVRDVNRDGLDDLVVHFRFGSTGFGCADIPTGAKSIFLDAKLTGEASGTPFQGEDTLRLVGKSR